MSRLEYWRKVILCVSQTTSTIPFLNEASKIIPLAQWFTTDYDQNLSDLTEFISWNDVTITHYINSTEQELHLIISPLTSNILEVKITATWRVLHQVYFHNGDAKLQCGIEAWWRHYHGDGKANVVKTEKFRFSCTKQVRFSPNMQPTQTICAVYSPTLGLGVWLPFNFFFKAMRIVS